MAVRFPSQGASREAGRDVIRQQVESGSDAPPWPDIYCTDEDRRQSFGIAVRTYEAMAHVYDALGYEIAELPRASVKDRLAFLLAETGATPPKRR